MKKLLAVALLLSLATFARAQITIDFTVGILTLADGSTAIPDGTLVQIVAAPTTGGFVAPTPTAFTSGSEILVYSGAFSSSFTGVPGEMDIVLPSNITTVPAGDALMLQWFPTLTTASTAPGYSTPYGQYMGQFAAGTAGVDPSWTAPAAGNTVTYTFFTSSSTLGTIANSVGAASQLTPAAVPEPATFAAIMGACALGFVAMRRRFFRV